MDNKSKKALSAGVWYIMSSFLAKAILYILTPLYTRLLTNSEYGQYNNFLSIQNILLVLMTFDLSSSVTLAYYDYNSENKFNGYISTIVGAEYLIPTILCLPIVIFKESFSELFAIRSSDVYLLCAYLILNNTLNIFLIEQRIKLKYIVASVLTILVSAFTAVVSIVFTVVFKDRLQGLLFGGIIVYAICGFIISAYYFRRSVTFKWEYLRYAVLLSAPLIPNTLSTIILGSSDKIMITKYCGDSQTAVYSLSYIFSLMITMIASAINKAWVPWFFDRLQNHNTKLVNKVAILIVCAVGFIAVFICLCAPEVLLLLGGGQYLKGMILMPPIMAACVLNCIATFFVNVEFYTKKTNCISIVSVFSAVVNLCLNYICIPRYGYIAAAYTTLVASAMNLILHILIVSKGMFREVFDRIRMLKLAIFFAMVLEMSLIFYNHNIIRYFLLMCILLMVIVICIKKGKQILEMIREK